MNLQEMIPPHEFTNSFFSPNVFRTSFSMCAGSGKMTTSCFSAEKNGVKFSGRLIQHPKVFAIVKLPGHPSKVKETTLTPQYTISMFRH